ncbi:Zn-dependent hydrolase [Hominifimenecus sp. rT4P-3]|uniref:Zn-dependent hydrolase n=1 Tax=Hominifimenecus sp. rT4P-3 TaxID=3242979 RepID=UPI003DA44F9E
MTVNQDKLREAVLKTGEIGRCPEGGITRLAFSQEYQEAVECLKKEMTDLGMSVCVDPIGNVIGTRPGRRKECILMGSHLDTVRNGGVFDGNLGIAAALEVIRCLNEADVVTEHTLQVVAFQAEEGGPLGGTFGSRAAMGLLDLDSPAVKEGLKAQGLCADEIRRCQFPVEQIRYFLELHIEQGNELFYRNIPIGVVSGIVGIFRCRIVVEGESNHAGTTGMEGRKDALVAFSRLAVEIDRIAREIGDHLVATAGVVHLWPNMANIIPGRVEAVLELRHMDRAVIEACMNQIKEAAQADSSVSFQFETLVDKSSVACDGEIMEILEDCCREADYPYMVMPSRAGHDTNAVARNIPSGMIFVPSKEGKSHCPEEWTEWADAAKGTEILLKAIEKLDERGVSNGTMECRRFPEG